MEIKKVEKNNASGETSCDARSLVIVSLGDSYSSGEGIEPYCNQGAAKRYTDLDFLAHRSKKSWPGRLTLPGVCGTMADHRNENWFFAAASGAKAKHILASQSKTARARISRSPDSIPKYRVYPTQQLAPQLDIFKSLGDKKADYVTLTLGGNDAGFSDVITRAIVGHTYIGISFLKLKLASLWRSFYEPGGIRDSLLTAYLRIAEAAGPQAQIIVAGYPRLFSPNGSRTLFSKQAVSIMNGAISDLNNHIEYLVDMLRARGVAIHFVSVEKGFEAHEAYTSDSDDPFVRSRIEFIHRVSFGAGENDIDAGKAAYAGSLHPNFLGSEVYRICVQKKIDELEKMRCNMGPSEVSAQSAPLPSTGSPFRASSLDDDTNFFWAESAPDREVITTPALIEAPVSNGEQGGKSIKLPHIIGGAAALITVGALVGTAAARKMRALRSTFDTGLGGKIGSGSGEQPDPHECANELLEKPKKE